MDGRTWRATRAKEPLLPPPSTDPGNRERLRIRLDDVRQRMLGRVGKQSDQALRGKRHGWVSLPSVGKSSDNEAARPASIRPRGGEWYEWGP